MDGMDWMDRMRLRASRKLPQARRERPEPVVCPPAQPGPHCVYLTLKKPSKLAAEKLAKKLRTDGAECGFTEDLKVSCSLDDAQLGKLFGAKVRYFVTAASASNRMICDAQVASFKVPSFKVPSRYADVAAVDLDGQCP
ncbi:MAG: hypothetical protein QM765_08180 [Myxococcales bacterium]